MKQILDTPVESRMVHVTRESGIPLIGCLAFGVIDRGENIIQVRSTSACNMNCQFCSTDGGPFSSFHQVNYMVDIEYLLEEVKKVIKIKGENVIIFLDSVGEPTFHPDFVKLVAGLKKFPQVSEIITITNGTYLSEKMIHDLEKAGLSQMNVSLHSLNSEKARKLFGKETYDVKKVLSTLEMIAQSKIKLVITPVYLPKVNEEDIEEIIQFTKSIHATLGIQKYEIYPQSRKMKSVKQQNYWKFYNQLRQWSKKFHLDLIMKKKDVHIESRPRIPEVFKVGEKVSVLIKAPGWFPKQKIGVARDRCISINNCNASMNDRVNIKILETKNNIYIGEVI